MSSATCLDTSPQVTNTGDASWFESPFCHQCERGITRFVRSCAICFPGPNQAFASLTWPVCAGQHDAYYVHTRQILPLALMVHRVFRRRNPKMCLKLEVRLKLCIRRSGGDIKTFNLFGQHSLLIQFRLKDKPDLCWGGTLVLRNPTVHYMQTCMHHHMTYT